MHGTLRGRKREDVGQISKHVSDAFQSPIVHSFEHLQLENPCITNLEGKRV